MNTWNPMAEALPPVDTPTAEAQGQAPSAGRKPQDHGWVMGQAYDYTTYNKSNKELADDKGKALLDDLAATQANFAAGGFHSEEWAGNAAVYEWNDEFGDVGPRHPQLEEQLFGDQNHMKAGIQFSRLTSIDVVQEGGERLQPVRHFEDAGLHPVILETVKMAGYDVPTPIQAYTLPAIFKNYDIVASAQTGSGKTAAFLIPILSKLMGKAKKLAAHRPNPATYDPHVHGVIRAEPLVLIVVPNRELATQIFDEARRFCYRTMFRPAVVYGGGPLAEQINQLGKGADILIGTPGRLKDFIQRPHLLTLRRLKYMVLDEADEILQPDWEAEMKTIMSGGDQEEGNITYMMFSATFPKVAREIANEHLKHDHIRIKVGRIGSTHMNIKQDVLFVEAHSKQKCLYDLLMSTPPSRTMIFVNSQRAADELDDYLFNTGFPCTSIHAGRTQKEREDSIRAFRSGKSPILIATGVSARGIDIANVMHVINFDLPSTQYGGIEEYTHRIGRTGRIGNEGLATSFYNDRDEDIAETLTKTLLETRQPIPDFLERHIPEGFENGQGDISKLHFDADGDEEEGQGNEDGQAAGGWGAQTEQTTEPAAAWGASTDQPSQSTSTAWGAPPTDQSAQPPSATWAAAPEAPTVAGSVVSKPQGPPATPWTAQGAAPVSQSAPQVWGPPAAVQQSPFGGPIHAVAGPPVQYNAPAALQGPPSQNPTTHWGAPSATQAPVATQTPIAPPQATRWGAPVAVQAPAAPIQPQTSQWGAPVPNQVSAAPSQPQASQWAPQAGQNTVPNAEWAPAPHVATPAPVVQTPVAQPPAAASSWGAWNTASGPSW